jgi:DNA or RNA helicases of superfamily II
MVTGETPKKEREAILKRFKNKRIKYIVNVAVLTTGFDAPHVDVVALLRATESVSLLQQIVGRGLRLSENKTDVLIFDYAGNIERHCPDGDVFAPRIQAKTSSSGFTIDIKCPTCSGINKFSGRPNPNSYEMDEEGYFIDLAGEKIISDMDKPLPAHFGRRCQNYSIDNSTGEWVQCSHRWSYKDCKECGEENDIAARYCKQCKGELIDPNEKLQIEFKKLKKNPYEKQIDEIINIEKHDTISQAGNPCVRVEFTTPYRSFTVWIQRNPKTQTAANDLAMFKAYWGKMKTVTYKKEPNGFYKVLNFNEEIQHEPRKTN